MNRHASVAAEGVCVVIPARNEELLIGRALTALQDSVTRALAGTPTTLQIVVVVVADGCTDQTASIARRFSGVHVVERTVETGNVGAARAEGVRRARELCRASGIVWIACTDADSAVPPDWITQHLGHARAGADVVLGAVRPDGEDLSAEQAEQWRRTHEDDSAPRVYGANLGIDSRAYDRVEGFAPLAAHEDVDIVRRIRAAGGSIVTAPACEVLTSGRTNGRTRGGFADYVRTQLLGNEVVVP